MILVEVVCCSPDDCRAAEAAGADRIELCTAIGLGGLTPSLGLFRAARAATTLPIMVMIRPREGGFSYSPSELATMLADVAAFRGEGAEGVVFGAFPLSACAPIVEASAGLETVFHRAFDEVPDPFSALEELIALGIKRVLTSRLQGLMERAAGRVEILAAGGIRSGNALEICRQSGCVQVHLGPFVAVPGAGPYGGHMALDGEEVRAVKSRLAPGI